MVGAVLAAVQDPPEDFGQDGPELLFESVAETSHDGADERAAQPDHPLIPVVDVLNKQDNLVSLSDT